MMKTSFIWDLGLCAQEFLELFAFSGRHIRNHREDTLEITLRRGREFNVWRGKWVRESHLISHLISAKRRKSRHPNAQNVVKMAMKMVVLLVRADGAQASFLDMEEVSGSNPL